MHSPIHLVVAPTQGQLTAALLPVTLAQAPHTLWLLSSPRAAGPSGVRAWTFAELAARVLDEPRLLTDGQRRRLAEEVATDLTARGELAHFARVSDTGGFIAGLLGMVGELQRAGVSARSFARVAVSDRDHERARLYAGYMRAVHRLAAQDADSLVGQAMLALTDGLLPVLKGWQRVVVEDASVLTPSQLTLLLTLAEYVSLWIGIVDDGSDDRAELFRRPRQLRERLADGAIVDTVEDRPSGPAGLRHLRRQLFVPVRRIAVSVDADGLRLIEAPGVLGEVRLVARAVRGLLDDGVPADEVFVVARDLGGYADRIGEVFAEYAIPAEVGGTEPLARRPAVALLLRAARLPEDDFPFAAVTALLRHTFVRPAWPEGGGPLRAEALLRRLGLPRGRLAYLAAADRWAERPPPALEDEAAEESRRRQTHELAKECRAFLHRFFRCWDGAPEVVPPAEHVAWLWRLADELGITAAAAEHDRDAFELFRAEVQGWQGGPVDRRTFARRLAATAAGAGLPRGPGGPGRVRVLAAEEAQHVAADHVFLVGLGERGFPRPHREPSLLDEADREALAAAGLPVDAGDRLPDEMLLFYRVVTSARRGLVLSYPAVDERGQELLPGSFLLAVLDCFAEGAVPTTRRRMLLEGLHSDTPLSAAEQRVRAAAEWPAGAARLSEPLRASLADAAEAARQRFGRREFTPYDGLFADPLLVEWVGRLFPPRRVFSPTALEDYVACPFRFLLRHVLRLEPLEEPAEEIEQTRRGMAYHRALARLHRRLREQGVEGPTAAVEAEAIAEVRGAVEEDVERAPSAAAQTLWRLEGERLLRSAARYAAQWRRFVEPWTKHGVAPRPHLFEVDFGLPVAEGQAPAEALVLRAGGIEVRVSGRIDRVDVAELEDGLGFWVIDYKTGRASNYTGSDLAAYRKLQLTLYAAAVESVLLAGRPARPLGLAYWLVTEDGPKVALPGRAVAAWLEDRDRWPAVRAALTEWVAALAANIRRGAFPLAPRSEHCTATCPYAQVCRISQARAVGKTWELELP